MGKIFELSPDNKVLTFRGKTIDLNKEAPNKIFQSDSFYWRQPIYNSAETTPETPNYPIPDSSGKMILFNRKKTELGTKGDFRTNIQEASSFPDKNWALIMGLAIKFFPNLDVPTFEALQKANFKLTIKKDDTQAKIEKFLLDITQLTKASYSLAERTITNTELVTPDGIHPPKSVVNVEQQSPMKLDETRYILFNPGELYEVSLEPEQWAGVDIPYPTHSDNLKKFRQYVYVHYFGLFTDVEKYI